MLTKPQRRELLLELKKEREKKFADRIRVILLIDDSETMVDISKFLFLDEGTIRNYRKRYESGGIEKLLNDYYVGRVSYLDESQKKLLFKELKTQVYPTTQSVLKFVERDFGVTYTIGGITSLLHQIGFSYKKPKGVPGKMDPTKQQKFINQYNAVKAHGPVYFGDSTHPMLNPVLSSGWIEKGTDFEVKTNSGRQRVNINGAIEMSSLDVISRSCKTVNKESMCELLRAIRKKNPVVKNLYLVLDNAAYNRAKKVKNLAKSLNIKILYLPPYSPNLNPIERLWKFMKKKVMANQHYEDLATFEKAVMSFMRNIRKHKKELSTLITDNFQVFQHQT